jgi:hypothetical protein
MRGYIRLAVPDKGADYRGLIDLDALRTIDEAIPGLSSDKNSSRYAGDVLAQAIAPHLGTVAPHIRDKDLKAHGASLVQRLRNEGWVQVVAGQVILTSAGKEKIAAAAGNSGGHGD